MPLKLKLPEKIGPLAIISGYNSNKESDAHIEGFNICLRKVKSMNPEMEIDVEALARIIELTLWGREVDATENSKECAKKLIERTHLWIKEKGKQ